jgi:uncharacterized protein YjbI with pentapeptide repeats
MKKTQKRSVLHRDPPDLPHELESAGDLENLFGDTDVITITEKRLHDLQRTNLSAGSIRIEGSLLERIQLAEGTFGSAVWKDVRMVGCDLANIRAHRISLVRVELIDCRLTGFRANALDWRDVLVQNGDVRYAQFHGGTFRTCEFNGCNLQDADLQEADLSGSLLRACNLARADLRHAKLRNTDLRKSEVEGMFVGVGDLQGAIVDPAQAMILARLMGLQIS